MKIKHLLFAVVAMSLCAVSCNTPEEPQEPTNELKTFTVSLNLTGEIDVTENPLTRFTPDSNDLYGIQINYKPVSGGGYQHYAYGLFDDLSDTSIELIENHLYEFHVTVIDNGKNIIYSDMNGAYGSPFDLSNNSNCPITNKFILSNIYFSDLSDLVKNKKGDLYYSYPYTDADAYHGIASDYKPTADGERISISLKRMVYGLKIVAGDFLTEGVLKVMDYGYSYTYTYVWAELTPEDKELNSTFIRLYGADNWYHATDIDKASTTHKLDFTWTKADGTVYEYEAITVTVNRLKETVVHVDFYEDTSTDGFSVALKYEEAEITAGKEYTHGDEQSDYDW